MLVFFVFKEFDIIDARFNHEDYRIPKLYLCSRSIYVTQSWGNGFQQQPPTEVALIWTGVLKSVYSSEDISLQNETCRHNSH